MIWKPFFFSFLIEMSHKRSPRQKHTSLEDFSFSSQNMEHKNITLADIYKPYPLSSRAGHDCRYNETEEDNIEFIYKIIVNSKKMDLLKKLESNEISIYDKLYMIESQDQERESPYLMNISAGGLWTDWFRTI